MSLANLMLRDNKPPNWQINNSKYDGIFVISRSSDEYAQVVELLKRSNGGNEMDINSVRRVQNSNFYCQFLCRRESLARSGKQYYTVRQFIVVSPNTLDTALKYNLDPRRLNIKNLVLSKTIPYTDYDDEVLLIVNVLTTDPNRNSQPQRSTDYYIEYIVFLD